MKYIENLSEKAINWIGTPWSILVHTLFFIFIFGLRFVGFTVDNILLILTTAVSLEAIYMAIFIQMAVNKTSHSLREVEKDIDDIQEDVEDFSDDIEDQERMISEIKAIQVRLEKLQADLCLPRRRSS